MAITTISSSLGAVGNGSIMLIKRGSEFAYDVSGTFVGTWILEVGAKNADSWVQVATGTSSGSGSITVSVGTENNHVRYRFRCSAYTSGSIVTEMNPVGEEILLYEDQEGNKILEVNEDGATFHKDSICEKSTLGSVPSAVSSTCTVVHYGAGPFIKSVFTLDSMVVNVATITTGNGVGGTQIFDFPEGHIRNFGCTADLSIAVTTEGDYTDATPQGDVGVGTLAPANADALGTDATDDSWATATAFTMSSYAATVDLPPEAAANYDGSSTAINLFLNAFVDAADMDDGIDDDMLFSGTITVHWSNLGDY